MREICGAWNLHTGKRAETDEVKEVEAAAAANPTAPAQAASTTVTAAPTPAQPTAPTTAAPTASAVRAEDTYTLDALSRAGAALVDAGMMPQLLDLLTKYGVRAVVQLPKEQYGAFADELKALGGVHDERETAVGACRCQHQHTQ